jgi:hypothetical protein
MTAQPPNAATIDCPDCAAPIPVRTAVMVAGRDGLFRVHGVCPIHGYRTVGPLTSSEIAVLRAARVLQATEVTALTGPIEQIPAAASTPLTWGALMAFKWELDCCMFPAQVAAAGDQRQ